MIFRIFYSVLNLVVVLLALLLSPLSKKLRIAIKGRVRSIKKLKALRAQFPESDILWFHASSLGEYLQIEPVINQIGKNGSKIVVSFYSPSGYENVKNNNIDCKIFLPFDFLWMGSIALRTVLPKKLIFTTYDVWPNFIFAANKMSIPTFLVSAKLDLQSSSLFKRYIYKNVYKGLSHIFAATTKDQTELEKFLPGKKIEMLGNARYDSILSKISSIDFQSSILDRNHRKALLLASIKRSDNATLFPKVFSMLDEKLFEKIIIIPHEVDEETVTSYEQIIKSRGHSYRRISSIIDIQSIEEKIILVDSIGLLYQFCWQSFFCYVGGGFSSSGVHNLIEPAVASNIIFFGPNYRNNNLFDAEGLMNRNAAFKIDSGEDFLKKLSAFFQNEEKFLSSADEGANFVKENSGAVSKLLERLINE